MLDELADDDAIFTVDTGMNNVWAARYLTPNGRRRVIGSFIHGTMANALPHAIGAALAAPGRQVIAMSGDGGLSMLLGELLTVRQHQPPADGRRVQQLVPRHGRARDAGRGISGARHRPRRRRLRTDRRAAGLDAVRITEPGGLRDGLARAFASPTPTLVDVVTDPNALSLPPHVTATQIRGFATAATKTVLAGGVGKMLEMARSNLRNIRAL